MHKDLKKVGKLKLDSVIGSIIPESIFGAELHQPVHHYIKSGNCYEWYYALAQYYAPKSIYEIGNRFGYSAIALMMGAPKTCQFHGLDIEQGIHGGSPNSGKILKKNLRSMKLLGRCNLIKGDSQQMDRIDGHMDLVHIDGDHTYRGALHDMSLFVDSFGVMLVDDYNSSADVRRAADEYIKKHGHDSYTIESVRGLKVILGEV